MILKLLLLAICVSIDSLGIGFTYGVKNTKIYFNAQVILFVISLIVTLISVTIGNYICKILSPDIAEIIGCVFLCIMGMWIIVQSFTDNKKHSKKEHNFLNYCDLDKSNKIDSKEALFLGIALSLDSIGIGVGSSIIGLNSFLFPIFVSSFQLFFLYIGRVFGKKIRSMSKLPNNIWSIIAGSLLILIGLSKFVF